MAALAARSLSASGRRCSPSTRASRSPTSSELMPSRWRGRISISTIRYTYCNLGTAMRYSLFSVNDHYPRLARSVPQLYQQVIHSCELAERLGFDTFFCAEHHIHEYGVVPDPAVMLSALAQRTKRIPLGTAISILNFHDPPRMPEPYSMGGMM